MHFHLQLLRKTTFLYPQDGGAGSSLDLGGKLRDWGQRQVMLTDELLKVEVETLTEKYFESHLVMSTGRSSHISRRTAVIKK
jgi:hypothetical protein